MSWFPAHTDSVRETGSWLSHPSSVPSFPGSSP